MAFELREGQGTLFKNNKDGNEKRPDYRGEINVDGTVYELAAWIKEGRKGKYMSLNAKPKGGSEQDRAIASGPPPPPADDEPLPF